MYKLLTLLLAVAALAPVQAQLTLTLTGPATARPGTAPTLGLSTTGGTATAPAAIQWQVAALPTGWTIAPTVPSTAAAAAGKDTITCNPTKLTCNLWGMNQGVLPNGPVAGLVVQIPATATPGQVTIQLTATQAADRAGVNVVMVAGAPYIITVLSRSDLNGDGTVNSQDAVLMATQSAGGATCTDDQNGDGQCSPVDIMIVVLRAMGVWPL